MTDDRATRRLNEARFTQTAGTYAAGRITSRRPQFESLLRFVEPGPRDRVLDVACGPGALISLFVPKVGHAVGVDLTPAMLREARSRAPQGGVLSLVRAEAERLPFGDGAFTIALCTWAVHHFADPRVVVDELARVVGRGGRVAIEDTVGSEDPAKLARQNEIERLRDPAHVAMVSRSGLEALVQSAGLEVVHHTEGTIRRELDEWLKISQTPPDVSRRVRQLLLATQPGDTAGMAPGVEGDHARFVHRWVLLVAKKI